ncbi:MAG TPA: TlpA disulfide reductase family protein [Bacteroidales bacterium]
MKNYLLLLLMMFPPGLLISQTTTYAAFQLTNLDGERVSSADLLQNAKPTVIIFWKSGSANCCDNLENMQTAWLEMLKEKNVRMLAICEDFNGDWSHVKPFVYGKNWEFEVYLDVNGDCRRAMQVTTLPFTIVFDENQQMVCSYAGYCKGNEDILCEKILHLLNFDNADMLSINNK